MDLLPPHLKHKILSFDPNLMNAAYGDNDKKNKKEEKEEKTTYPSLTIKDESKLHSLSPSQVKELEKEGYLVVDNFLGRESLLKFKVLFYIIIVKFIYLILILILIKLIFFFRFYFILYLMT